MTAEADIALIKRQEQELALPAFDEHVAFAIGSAIRERARAEGLALIVDLRTWDRQMFFSATPGSGPDNADWVRRKVNTVRRFQKATYRILLERNGEFSFPAYLAADSADFVIAGGGFPLRVAGAGIIGSIAVSGLPGREDHNMIVAAFCDHLNIDRQSLALPPE